MTALWSAPRRPTPDYSNWFGETVGGVKIGTLGRPQPVIGAPDLSRDQNQVVAWALEETSPVFGCTMPPAASKRASARSRAETGPFGGPGKDQITYSSWVSGNRTDLFIRQPHTRSEAVTLAATKDSEYTGDWSANGEYLVFRRGGDIWGLRRREGADPIEDFRVVGTEFDELSAQLSPDARFVSYTSNESGRYEVYVQPFPDGGRVWQVTNGGVQARWRNDGKELFYVEGDTLIVVAVTTRPAFSVGSATRLFEDKVAFIGRGQQYDVSADGDRFVVREVIRTRKQAIRVVQDWFAEFRDREQE